MKRKYFLILGLIVGLIGAYVIYTNFLSTGPSMSKLDTQVEVNAVDLMSAFEMDENNANEQYLNKILEVSGVITSIDLPEETKPSINLYTEGFGLIKCTLESADDFNQETMKAGTQLTVKGECIGYLLDVLINNTITIND